MPQNKTANVVQGNVGAILDCILRYRGGLPADLRQVVGPIIIKIADRRGVEFGGGVCVADPDQINNEGRVTYVYQAGDVATPGLYEAQFFANFTDQPRWFPNPGKLLIRVSPRA